MAFMQRVKSEGSLVMNIARSRRGDDWLTTLEEELSERSLLVERLDQAVRKQEALIESEDAVGLLSLLSERQLVVDRIESGAPRLVELLERFEQEGAMLELHRVATLRQLMERIGKRLEAVIAADATAAHSVHEAMSRIRERIEETTTTSKALHAYHDLGTPGARFSDRKA